LSLESAAPGVKHVPKRPGRLKAGLRQTEITAVGAVALVVVLVSYTVLVALVRRLRDQASTARSQARSRILDFLDR
jgi:hypothetical protein